MRFKKYEVLESCGVYIDNRYSAEENVANLLDKGDIIYMNKDNECLFEGYYENDEHCQEELVGKADCGKCSIIKNGLGAPKNGLENLKEVK